MPPVTLSRLPPFVVVRRLYVAPEDRQRYLEVMARLAAAAGGDLLARLELYEDDERAGFFLESWVYRDLAAHGAIEEKASGSLADLFSERRKIVAAPHEEEGTYSAVIGAGA